MASSFSPLTAVTASGTSLMFSDRFWAVTRTSPTSVASAVVWATAGAARTKAVADTLAASSTRSDADVFMWDPSIQWARRVAPIGPWLHHGVAKRS